MTEAIKISRDVAEDGPMEIRRVHVKARKHRSRKEMTSSDGDSKRETLKGSGDAPTPVPGNSRDGGRKLNKIQEATLSILIAGLNQIYWEPLSTLLEDLVSNGSVSRKKLHRCAKQVIDKILGADLETRVLQQFHSDVEMAEIILIEHLIARYVEQINEKSREKTREESRPLLDTSAAEERRRKHEKNERKKDKKCRTPSCHTPACHTPSYQKTTESFRLKQTNRQGSSRHLGQKRIVKQIDTRDRMETDLESKRDCSATSDHEMNRFIWTDIDESGLASWGESTKIADQADKKQAGRKQNVAIKNKRKVDGRGDWDKIETETALKTYEQESINKSQTFKPIISEDKNCIDNSRGNLIKSHMDATATNKTNKMQSVSNSGAKDAYKKGHTELVTPEKDLNRLTKVRPFYKRHEMTDERVDGTTAHSDKVAVEKNYNAPGFNRSKVKLSEKTTRSTITNNIVENECAKYCNRTTNTESTFCANEKCRTTTSSSLSSHSIIDVDSSSTGSDQASLAISDHKLEILKRKYVVRNSCEHSLNCRRIPIEEMGLPYFEIEKLRCFFKFILMLGLVGSIDTGPYSPYLKQLIGNFY